MVKVPLDRTPRIKMLQRQLIAKRVELEKLLVTYIAANPGMHYQQIGERFGYSKAWISELAKRGGVSRRQVQK